ncbi:QueT transporter family protein [Dolosicoccus paucivorans]|uniref:QueT transporter family protein n=1 Tax=Dolosicoccus paucivorans TaxID=84521 RepID=A0A1G8LHT6_9LACT|nr:QueT transporter family protein [Dolosicoccus paucivorans]PMB84796.1 QueT transporter family protein [Dolosicoccus paucivorans]PMC58562.1 QueT transporter family protein [Dolosicoccus paucivorans]SDI55188.1 Uncharacterized membrane protein [Dolosicoccus paucivorans]
MDHLIISNKSTTRELTQGALLVALYIILTFMLAPIAFGPLNFRLSEGLNILALYDKKVIRYLTIGVLITNYFSYGLLDMFIGSLSTLIFLHLSRYLAARALKIAKRWTNNVTWLYVIQYAVLILVFSSSMFTIAGMVSFLLKTGDAFWPLYLTLALSEGVALILGTLIIHPVFKRLHMIPEQL